MILQRVEPLAVLLCEQVMERGTSGHIVSTPLVERGVDTRMPAATASTLYIIFSNNYENKKKCSHNPESV